MRSRIYRSVKDPGNTIVVTDLDGTLLDFDTYSFDDALPAVKALKKRRIPIICCSSKTRSEIEYWRRKLQLNTPLICENGAAVFMPAKMFDGVKGDLKKRGDYLVREFGASNHEIRKAFTEVRNRSGISVEGFSDMDLKKVQVLCDFVSSKQAKKAADREYSEPFVFPEGTESRTIEYVIKELEKEGYNVIQGKRFFHLVGDIDKGRAVEYLREMYGKLHGTVPEVVGLGDSTNDLEMLEVVDYPVLVMGKNRRYNRAVKNKVKPYLAGAPGPEGWSRAITQLFDLRE